MPPASFSAPNIKCISRAAYDISREHYVFDKDVRATVDSGREEHGRTVLTHRPIIRHQIIRYPNIAAVLDLEQILNDPVFLEPCQRLIQVIIPNHAICGDQLQL